MVHMTREEETMKMIYDHNSEKGIRIRRKQIITKTNLRESTIKQILYNLRKKGMIISRPTNTTEISFELTKEGLEHLRKNEFI